MLSSKIPAYLADDIHLASESSARCLRSSFGRKCSVTRVHSLFDDRCFAAAGLRIWNNLGGGYLSVCETRKLAAQNQKITENIHVFDGLRRIVCDFFDYCALLNTLTYLFTGRPTYSNASCFRNFKWSLETCAPATQRVASDSHVLLWPAIYYMAGHNVTMRQRGSAA